MAVNTIDKLQFLSFAVLLSSTVHFLALRLRKMIMHQHTKILLNYIYIGPNDFRDIMFLAQDVIYTSRLCYDVNVCLSVCL